MPPDVSFRYIFLSSIFLSELERPTPVHVSADIRRLGQQEIGRIACDVIEHWMNVTWDYVAFKTIEK